MIPRSGKEIWQKHGPSLFLALVFALVLSACGGGGGGGGGAAPGPSPQTITGTVVTVSPSLPISRTASTGYVYLTDEIPVTSGSLSLVRVDAQGVFQEMLVDQIPVSASGSFSITLPAGLFGSSLVVLSHSTGLRAVVSRTTQQTVGIISTYAFQQGILAGLDLMTIQGFAGYEDQLKAAWQRQGVPVSPIQGQAVSLAHLVAGIQSLAEHTGTYMPTSPGPFCTRGSKVVVALGDQLGGNLAEVCLDNNFLQMRDGLASLSGDVLLKSYQGDIGVLSASPSHSLSTFSPITFRRTRGMLLQDGPEQATNPQDFVLQSTTRMWLSNENTLEILLMDPSNPSFVAGKISSLDLVDSVDTEFDLDGKPEPGHFVQSGNRLYVALRRLDTLQTNRPPASHSALLTIDTLTNTIVDRAPEVTGSQPLELPGRNCQASATVGDKLFVACPGYLPPLALSNSANLSSDGLYMVDLVSLSVSQVLSNASLGRKVMDLKIQGADQGLLTLKSLPSGQISLVRFNPGTQQMAGNALASGTLTAHGVDAQNRTWICEKVGTDYVLKVLDQDGAAVVPFPITLSRPITQFLFPPFQ